MDTHVGIVSSFGPFSLPCIQSSFPSNFFLLLDDYKMPHTQLHASKTECSASQRSPQCVLKQKWDERVNPSESFLFLKVLSCVAIEK